MRPNQRPGTLRTSIVSAVVILIVESYKKYICNEVLLAVRETT